MQLPHPPLLKLFVKLFVVLCVVYMLTLVVTTPGHLESVESCAPLVSPHETEEALECVKRNPTFSFRSWDPIKSYDALEVMSMVQAQPMPVGFPSRCDWVFGSRFVHWGYLPPNSAWANLTTLPRTIFLQTDELQKFHDAILPCFPRLHRFVLIMGDHDMTTPRQVDLRYPSPIIRRSSWLAWLRDERILHLFVEHLDTPEPRDRVTPVPVGLNSVDSGRLLLSMAPRSSKIRDRPNKMLFTNRIREGPQWKARVDIERMCQSLKHCEVQHPKNSLEFMQTVSQVPFLLCVHGGGVDPNPNAWTALFAGTIPIMEHFPGDGIYEGLPVYFVSNWTLDVTENVLGHKKQELAPFFEDQELRSRVLHKLSTNYWWNLVEMQLRKKAVPKLKHPGLSSCG